MPLPHFPSIKMRQITPSLPSSQKFNVTSSLDLSSLEPFLSVTFGDGHDFTAHVVVEAPSNNVPA